MFGQTCGDKMCERGKLFLSWSHCANKWIGLAANLPIKKCMKNAISDGFSTVAAKSGMDKWMEWFTGWGKV